MMRTRVPTTAAMWLAAVAATACLLATGCGSSMPSRADVERAVSDQIRGHGDDTKGMKVTSACAEETGRHYTCRVRASLTLKGLGTSTISPQTVHAVVSKDGKRILVED